RGGAGEAVLPVHLHRAGAANPLAAGAAEGERRILLGLDLDQSVEDHRPAAVEIDLEGIVARILAAIGIVAVDSEAPGPLRAGGSGIRLALPDPAVLREREFGHGPGSSSGR